jgi:hypothetical protein
MFQFFFLTGAAGWDWNFARLASPRLASRSTTALRREMAAMAASSSSSTAKKYAGLPDIVPTSPGDLG